LYNFENKYDESRSKEHTITIKDTQGDFTSFLKVTHQYKTFEKHNIIIDLSYHKDLTVKDVKLFSPLSEQHKKAKNLCSGIRH
jgi:hypothetical protein